MGQPWYIRFAWWLCEKTGHIKTSKKWEFGGSEHKQCVLCGRIVSKRLNG